jgi:hypothetical protein
MTTKNEGNFKNNRAAKMGHPEFVMDEPGHPAN